MSKSHSISKAELNRMHGFLIGSKLGDGSFIQRTPNHNVYITFKQSENQKEYLLWKYKFLKNIVNNNIKERNFTEGRKSTWQRQYYFSTVSLKELVSYNRYSIIDLLSELDEMALVVWMLDDGNCYKKGWKIACGRFSPEERQHAIRILKEKFDINAYAYEHPTKLNKGYIRINTTEFNKIKELIIKYIDEDIDVVKYKVLNN